MSTMKKISCFLCFIFVASIVGICNVKAATLVSNPKSVNVSTNSRDYTFTVTFSGTPDNEWKLSYPAEVYPTGTNPISNGKLSVESGTITFAVQKNLSLTEDKKITIKITNENSGEEATTEVTILKNKTTTTQPIPTSSTTTQASKSNNANLKTLEITGSDDSEVVLSPSFSSNVYEYSATVAGEVKTITINATMEDSKANMVVSNNATEELVAGENNKIVITVTAEDGTKKAYTINIKREALTADATLKSLTIKECSDFELKENKFSYNVKIKDSVKKLTLDYVTSDENAEVSISGNENLKNGSKVKILVTAQDGTKKEYVLNIVKDTETTKKSSVDVEAEKNPLIIMALSMVAFGLIGGIIYVIKK